MRALRDAQADFLAAVLGRDPALAAQWPRRGLSVYRSNARENFAAALEAAFPLLRALMGHGEFRAMAWAFQQRCPSRTGNLFYCGADLADFLSTHLAGTPDAPLSEVARFEWLIQQVLVAADEPARFNFEQLAAVPEAEHGSLGFHFHPAVRLCSSALPLFALWREYQNSGTVSPEPLAQGDDTEALLIRRAGDGIELHRLSEAEFRFLEALSEGQSLEAAVECASATGDTGLNPGELLARWVSAGVITGLAR
jgi:hypothetical protein